MHCVLPKAVLLGENPHAMNHLGHRNATRNPYFTPAATTVHTHQQAGTHAANEATPLPHAGLSVVVDTLNTRVARCNNPRSHNEK